MAKRHEAQNWIAAAAKYNGDDCLEWPFALTPKGYGSVRFMNRGMNAHRAVCLIAHGAPPSDKHTEVAHFCGNRRCCNPSHLRHATSSENKADALRHGTLRVGERAPGAKLRAEQVREILQSNEKGSVLARRFGVTDSAIWLIRRSENWVHLRDGSSRHTDP